MAEQSLLYDEMESPIGCLSIVSTDQGVCTILFGSLESNQVTLNVWLKKHRLPCQLLKDEEAIRPVIAQLQEYFEGKRHSFDVPLDLYGTPFQKRVWQALQTISYGETRSYKEIAQHIGAPKAVRAIGGANNQNPIPIIIPCHRVIGSNGAMVGYGGGLEKKEWLLSIEGAYEKIS